jgi:hypothetical protein
MPGVASRQPWRVGQEPGSRWPEEALPWGNVQLRRPFVLPTAVLGSGTPQ